jgi:membrane protease subunit (stomatin/prohibitin family)|tara:strand:- start:130 stop:420 length:291 start_codon:yes stop_codon:yes gene_type:complete
MKREKWTEYDKYICLADDTRVISGTYTGYVQFRELMESVRSMVQKNQNTYTYNGEVYVSELTTSEINKILSCLETGVYERAFDKVKFLTNKVNLRF